jgi:hypothetical protein
MRGKGEEGKGTDDLIIPSPLHPPPSPLLLCYHFFRMSSFPCADQEDRRNERRVERTWCTIVLVFVVAGLLVPTGFADAASSVTTLLNTLLLAIGYVLQWVIFFIARLVILVVDVVIQVAQYNHFVASAPVRNGWPLVRDVTNMFFIVILLITAFGTIFRRSSCLRL